MLLRRVVLLVSGIPSPRGKAIKTDRIDAGYLVSPVSMLKAFAKSVGRQFVKGQSLGKQLCPERA